MKTKMEIKTYTGGLAETHSYIVRGETSWLVIDAPQGVVEFLKQEKIKPSCLVLTHGHWDHIWDAAAIAREFSCPVCYHRDDEMLYTNPDCMRAFGLPVKLEPVRADRFLTEGDTVELAPWSFRILHVPGHCPGSICLYESKAGVLFGGDVLFEGGVGRWDLPGGSNKILIQNIREKLLSLPDETIVYAGHGDSTTIGKEKKTNPFF